MLINDIFLINGTLEFVLWNFLIILIGSIMFFFIKEYYRIKREKISLTAINIIGFFIGILLFFISLYVNLDYRIYLNNEPQTFYKELVILLNPAILYLIFYSVFFDKRLTIIFSFTIILSFLLKLILWTPDDSKPLIKWYELIFISLQILIISLIIFLWKEGSFIKNDNLKVIVVLVVYILLIILFKFILNIILMNSFMQINKIILLSLKLLGVEIGYLLIFILLQGLIIYAIERIYENSFKLETYATQDEISYYKLSLAQNELKNIIDKNKVNKGLIVLFDVKTENKYKYFSILKLIRQKTKDIYNKSFFFKYSSKYYGAFYEIKDEINLNKVLINNRLLKRTNNDIVKPISKTLLDIQEKNNIKINCAGSFYGIHSNDLSELLDLNKFLISPIVNKSNSNIIIIYDSKLIKDRIKEQIEVTNLPFNLKNININYLRGINNENIFYPLVSFGNKNPIFITNPLKQINNKKELEILLRFISYQSLRNFKKNNSSLVIYLPSSIIESDEFNIGDFVKKINRHLKNEKVIIGLLILKIKNSKKFKFNIKNLRKLGYRFAIVNPMHVTQQEHDLLNPEFIIDISNNINPFKINKKQLKIMTQAIILNTNLV